MYATSLVQASEALLKIVYELKLTLSLGDFENINAIVNERIAECETERVAATDLLSTFQSELNQALCELEKHYNESLVSSCSTTTGTETTTSSASYYI